MGTFYLIGFGRSAVLALIVGKCSQTHSADYAPALVGWHSRPSTILGTTPPLAALPSLPAFLTR